jgi:hypothetical protein
MPEDPDERIAVLIRIAYCAAIFLTLAGAAAYGQDRPRARSLSEILAEPGHFGYQFVTLPAPQRTVLLNEVGGRIDVQWIRFQLLAHSGEEVEIRGLCPSACTLITAHIPQERLCIGKDARLAFHQARYADGRPDVHGTQWMLDKYPAPIRAWLESRELPLGGTNKFLVLFAPDLWGMGYRRCAD